MKDEVRDTLPATEGAAEARPAALDWSIDTCTVQRALHVVGDRWSFVVLREIFLGVRRFDDLRQRTTIPRQVLTDRLARLVVQDVLRREPYQAAGQRVRDEYRLTAKGFALYPVLVALNDWGSAHYAEPEGPPLRFEHRGCGADVHAHLRCTAGHDLPGHRATVPAPGPGARRRSR